MFIIKTDLLNQALSVKITATDQEKHDMESEKRRMIPFIVAHVNNDLQWSAV